MSLTVQDIYNLNEGLSVINEKELPVSTAFKLQRISMKVSEEFNVASGLRMKIIEKYKDKKLDNGTIKIKKDKLEDFNKEIEELMSQKVKVSLDKVALSELESITVKTKTLIHLDKILKEDKQNETGNSKKK